MQRLSVEDTEIMTMRDGNYDNERRHSKTTYHDWAGRQSYMSVVLTSQEHTLPQSRVSTGSSTTTIPTPAPPTHKPRRWQRHLSPSPHQRYPHATPAPQGRVVTHADDGGAVWGDRRLSNVRGVPPVGEDGTSGVGADDGEACVRVADSRMDE